MQKDITRPKKTQDYEQAVADLDRRYDEMLERLDGSYQTPKKEK
jgi:hypothetical protein